MPLEQRWHTDVRLQLQVRLGRAFRVRADRGRRLRSRVRWARDLRRVSSLGAIDTRLSLESQDILNFACAQGLWNDFMTLIKEVRTSLSDPIRVNWLSSNAAGGAVGMTFAPGKRHASTYGYVWERELELDLEELARGEGVNVLVSLIEDHELAKYGIENLFLRAPAHGLAVYRLPIVDVGVPASTRRDDVAKTLAFMRASVAAGKRVAVHCIGGLGRTGTIAGCYLVSTGMRAVDARAILRDLRGGKDDRCPETPAQRDYIRDWELEGALPPRGLP
jgi:protein-tyrosine phosphatase